MEGWKVCESSGGSVRGVPKPVVGSRERVGMRKKPEDPGGSAILGRPERDPREKRYPDHGRMEAVKKPREKEVETGAGASQRLTQSPPRGPRSSSISLPPSDVQ